MFTDGDDHYIRADSVMMMMMMVIVVVMVIGHYNDDAGDEYGGDSENGSDRVDGGRLDGVYDNDSECGGGG